MKKIAILFMAILTVSAYGQSDQEKARELGRTAVQEMDAGNIEYSIELLEQSIKLDPTNITYPYEIAYARYLAKDYAAAIKELKKLTKHEQVYDRVWQMLGNCYDMDKKPEKAIEAYEEGLKIFPNSGILYLERGYMELNKGEYNNALGFYESGIDVNPEFPSNYYWAAKLYLNSTDEVWGMIYGEIFMNIERNTARTADISKMLYDTYKSEITFTSDTSASVSFCQNMTINVDDFSNSEEIKLPFGMIYEPALLLSIAFEDSIDLNSLHKIREGFVKNYFENGNNEKYPNVLFDYQKEMMDLGHLEAYNHYILMKGDEDAFAAWLEENKEKWDSFIDWYSENPLLINGTRRFTRGQY